MLVCPSASREQRMLNSYFAVNSTNVGCTQTLVWHDKACYSMDSNFSDSIKHLWHRDSPKTSGKPLSNTAAHPSTSSTFETNASYVLLSAEQFERMKTAADGEIVDAMYPLLADIAPEDWEDASLYAQEL